MILTIRTDKPEAEMGLYERDGTLIVYKKWQAHRELSTTILKMFSSMLAEYEMSSDDLSAVIYYEGPGSFTGLRIGAAFVNALETPVVNSQGENWIEAGISRLSNGEKGTALPHYGSAPHVTRQKK